MAELSAESMIGERPSCSAAQLELHVALIDFVSLTRRTPDPVSWCGGLALHAQRMAASEERLKAKAVRTAKEKRARSAAVSNRSLVAIGGGDEPRQGKRKAARGAATGKQGGKGKGVGAAKAVQQQRAAAGSSG